MIINRILKWLVGTALVILLLLVAGTFLLNTNSVQQWLLRETSKALSEKLQTKVSADSISVNLFMMQMSLYGLSVDDRQGREMFAVRRFDADVSLKSILQWRVVINKVGTEGLQANLIKERTDSAANYQFVVDALAKKEKPEEQQDKDKPKSKVKIDFRHLVMSGTDLSYSQPAGKAKAHADLLDLYLSGEEAEVQAENVRLSADGMTVGKERVKHADLSLSFQGEAEWDDELHAEGSIKNLNLRCPEKKIDIRGLRLKAEADGHTARVQGLALSFGQYGISLTKADVAIPGSQSWKDMNQLTVNAAGLIVKEPKTGGLAQVGNVTVSLVLGKKPDLRKAELSGLKLRYATKKQSINAAADQVKAGRLKNKYTLAVSGLKFCNDNHKPRKNTGKPKRGWFDAGHLNISAQMNWVIDFAKNGLVNAQLVDATVKDAVAGIDMKKLKMNMALSESTAQITGLSFQQMAGTTVSVASAQVVLPSKKEGRTLSFQTGIISAQVILADIAHLFAPVLKDFKLPLRLTTTMNGDQNTLHFKGVNVSTLDQGLTISADGDITHLREKHKLVVSFQVAQMLAKVGTPELVINQFQVKKMMMNQLHKLGDIRYSGSFEVVYKKENFQGRLTTNAGPIDFTLSIDNAGKWVSGKVKTEALNIGKVLEMENLGDVKASAEFKVDISKKRTAAIRREKGGKLPICTVSAKVDECGYKRIHIHNLDMELESDGAVANGQIIDHGKLLDLSCRFSFTDTDQMNKMKITKAGIKLHKRDEKEKEERKKAKEEHKKEKQEQKEERKKLKQEQKEERKQERQELKVEKQKQKEETKAEKQKQKEEKQNQKQETKSEKQNQKQEIKSEKQNQKAEKQNQKQETKSEKQKQKESRKQERQEIESPGTPADSTALPAKKKKKLLNLF